MKFHNRLDTTLKVSNDLIEFKNQSFYRIVDTYAWHTPRILETAWEVRLNAI